MKRKNTEPYVRLTQPLVRDSGVLRPATWEEALDRAAAGFRRTLDGKGPEAFGMFSCARATNEMNYVAQKFTRTVIGTNNVDSCNRTCHAPSVAGLARVFDSGGGTSSYQEIEDADVIVVWGGNPREAHPIFFQHVLKAVHRGAKLFVIDPRRTSTASWAHRQLQLHVGTDIPLAHAIAREIIHSGLANTAFIERATEGFAEFGTFTNSERRVQRVRKALDPPEGARDDIQLLCELARRLGHDWHYKGGEDVWNELRTLSPMHAGMSYARLEELGGIQWPCYSEDKLEPTFLHGRLWEEDPAKRPVAGTAEYKAAAIRVEKLPATV